MLKASKVIAYGLHSFFSRKWVVLGKDFTQNNLACRLKITQFLLKMRKVPAKLFIRRSFFKFCHSGCLFCCYMFESVYFSAFRLD